MLLLSLLLTEDAQAQRSAVTCSSFMASKWQGQGPRPGLTLSLQIKLPLTPAHAPTSLGPSHTSIYKSQVSLHTGTSRLHSPGPRDTHVVGFSDQPLFVVQNVPDAADQVHGAAVVRVLKGPKSSYQGPSSAPTTPVAGLHPRLPLPQPWPQLPQKPQELSPDTSLSPGLDSPAPHIFISFAAPQKPPVYKALPIDHLL